MEALSGGARVLGDRLAPRRPAPLDFGERRIFFLLSSLAELSVADEINPYNAALPPPSGSPFAPSPGEVSEVVYEIEVEDLVELALHNQQRSRTLRRQFILVRVILAIGGASAILAVSMQGLNMSVMVGVFAIASIMFLLLLPIIVKRRHRRLLRKLFLEGSNRLLVGPRRLRLTPGGLMFHSELMESAVKWPAVESIETNAEYAYLYIASYQANIVPRRAFNDDLQFRSFVELARRYWREATGASPASA